MRKIRIILGAFSVVLSCGLAANPIYASGAARTFVAAGGLDGNPCSFTLPCRSLQAGFNATAPGGEIDVMDPAGYGTLIITHAISIQGHGYAGMSGALGGTMITINAGVTDSVTLRGLLIDGVGVATMGIAFNSGAALNIQDCLLRNFNSTTASDGAGIAVLTATNSKLFVSDTLISNGNVGVWISAPSNGSTATGILNRVSMVNMTNASTSSGLVLNYPNGVNSGSIQLDIDSSIMAFNKLAGLRFDSTPASATNVLLRNSLIAYNLRGIDAVSILGPVLRLTRSTIIGNPDSAATISATSYLNNDVFDNGPLAEMSILQPK